MSYPFVLFYRFDKYALIDSFFSENNEKLECTIHIINDSKKLNCLFDPNYQILITYGEDEKEYYPFVEVSIPERICKRWIHFKDINSIESFNSSVNNCFIHNASYSRESIRPKFSIFTTCFNSYEKITRAYESIKKQTFVDWEWVIVDDSSDDNHFNFLRDNFSNDLRIRMYKRSCNSGNIGNVKNEAVSLCRGKYVLELDHDDEILCDVLKDSAQLFETNNDIGFIYMNFANVYENGTNFSYGDFICKGYGSYYCQKYEGKWLYVYNTPNINNITLSHLVCCPNHPRIWRREILIQAGNYCELLPICDDYEILLRTCLVTKTAKINKLGYIQYINSNNNNFSLIRNREINRIGPQFIMPIFYDKFNIHELMKKKNAYEDEKYIHEHSQIWTRDSDNYKHVYLNIIHNLDYDKQICILGLDSLTRNMEYVVQIYKEERSDFILLENKYDISYVTSKLDELCFNKMKCYSLINATQSELTQYFMMMYRSCENYEIITKKLIDSERKKITIITPSIRPENLIKVKESINFDYVNEWIIVYDGSKISENPNIFLNESNSKIKEYIHSGEGISGNPQRNFALDNISNENTYLYFLDDDNIIHQDLYTLLDRIEDNKIYTFDQIRPPDVFPYKEYLPGNNIELFNIDTAMFLIDYNLCKNVKWDIHKYNADGIYIVECYELNKENWIYINKVIAHYNYLSVLKKNT